MTGRVAEAELHLHAWCRHAAAPAGARLLLGALLARRGATGDAMAVLERTAHHAPDADADTTRLHISVLVQAGLLDTARRLVRLLHDGHGHHPAVAQWIAALDLFGKGAANGVSHAEVEHLAAELIEAPQVIPSLVAAAMIEPRREDIDLLRSAIQRIAADAADDRQVIVICQAMAQLAMLALDRDDARRWAHRGLKLDPYNATLALVLGEVSDDLNVGPAAADVLRRVATAHPTYPDVRASLIRREHSDGRPEAARIKLAQWLEQDPANPHALDMVRELAA
jgi:lipopolysaccharide biosynthesis regulator YciM